MTKSLSDILSSGASADKYRDHLGETLTITDWVVVNTKNGESVQLLVRTDYGEEITIWAPSVVARQVKDLAGEGFLPARLRFDEAESVEGRAYFTLAEPADEGAA